MPKAHHKSPLERAKLRLRGGSDRERALYVGMRKALAPRTTRVRVRAARAEHTDGIQIPEDRGYAILRPGVVADADEVVSYAQERLATTDIGVLSRKGKQFMLPLVEQSALDRESPLLRLALRRDVLAGVASYLGTVPLLTNINLYLSRSTNRELISSQLFHCDADDTRQVKVFVLCSEVTPENGPLMIMDAADSEDLRERVGYRYKDRVTDEQADAACGALELVPVQGATGTVCLVDTSRCFHYGSRVDNEASPRLAAMLQYLTPHSFMLPRDPSRNAPFKGLASPDDPELVRLVLGA